MSIGRPLREEYSNFHPHAEIEVDPGAPLVTVLPTADIFVQVVNWGTKTISPQGRIIADELTGDITVQERGFGIYQFQNNCSYFSSRANVVVSSAIFLNGVQQSKLSWTRSLQTINSVANAGFSQVLQLNTGDVINFRMAVDTNNVTITLVDGALSLFWLSGE